ncbi:MAG: sensor histidine kinase [Gammaproteobacteria bacterium]
MRASTYRTSLRARIIVALVVIVTVTSSLFAIGVLFMKEKLEEVIFDRMVRSQLEQLVAQLDAGTYDPDRLFEGWSFHFEDTGTVDPILHALPPGSHHSVRVGERHFQVEVAERNGHPVYLTYDITEWENLEHRLLGMLAWAIAALAIVTIAMGRQASRAILAPVNALTARLAAMQPRQRNLRIAAEFEGDEIGRIARAFDQYMERLDHFVERERSFTAAASHELRTPLSVMLGALDVLETQEQSAPGQRAIARMRRACGEMRAFIEATLLLSREDGATIQQEASTDVPALVAALIEDIQPLLQERKVSISTDIPPHFTLPHPPSLVQIMLGNILRNAIEHTRAGSIELRVRDGALTIRDTGCGIAAADLPRIFERSYTTKKDGVGLGLNLVKRICDRFGWQIDVTSAIGEGTTVTLAWNRPS